MGITDRPLSLQTISMIMRIKCRGGNSVEPPVPNSGNRSPNHILRNKHFHRQYHILCQYFGVFFSDNFLPKNDCQVFLASFRIGAIGIRRIPGLSSLISNPLRILSPRSVTSYKTIPMVAFIPIMSY